MSPLCIATFEKTSVGTLCRAEEYEITSEGECKQAGELLGLQWAHSFNQSNDFPACLYADDGRNMVYFNLSPNPERINLNPKYSALCMTTGKNNHIIRLFVI